MDVHGQLKEASLELVTATPANLPEGKIYQKSGRVAHVSGGAEKILVDENTAQNLSNKLLDKPEILNEQIVTPIAKPSAPAAGKYKLYMKADGNWYRQDSAGVEVLVNNVTSLDAVNSRIDSTIAEFDNKLALVRKNFLEFSAIAAPLISINQTGSTISNFQVVDPTKNCEYYYGAKTVIFTQVFRDFESKSSVEPTSTAHIIETSSAECRAFGNSIVLSGGNNGVPYKIDIGNAGRLKFSFFGTAINLLAVKTNDGGFTPTDSFNLWLDGVVVPMIVSKADIVASETQPFLSIPVAKNLTPGYHEIEMSVLSSTAIALIGYESFCSTPVRTQGSLYVRGNVYELTQQSFNPSVDFPVGANGGRVTAYHDLNDNTTKHIVNNVGLTALYGTSVTHAEEEVIKTYVPQDFSFRYATDPFNANATAALRGGFSSDRMASLHGTMKGANGEMIEASGASLFFNFFGTGLDIELGSIPISNQQDYDIFIDGKSTSDAKIAYNNGFFQKVCQNLPLSSHRIEIRLATTGNGTKNMPMAISKFVVYGPKKPALAPNQIPLAQFYVMPAFNAANITAVTTDTANNPFYGNAVGTYRVCAVEHCVPSESASAYAMGTNMETIYNGLMPVKYQSPSTNQRVVLSLTGTGFVLRFEGATSSFPIVDVLVNGQILTSGNFPGATIEGYPALNMNPATGKFATGSATMGRNPSLMVSGLPFGTYLVEIVSTAGTLKYMGCDVISPVVGTLEADGVITNFNNGFIYSGVSCLKPSTNKEKPREKRFLHSTGWFTGGAPKNTTTTFTPIKMTNLHAIYSKGQNFRVKAVFKTTHSAANAFRSVQMLTGGFMGATKYQATATITNSSTEMTHLFDHRIFLPKGWHKIDFALFNETAGTATFFGPSTFEMIAEEEV